MRTTLDIDDRLLGEAKALAAIEHISLTRLIQEGLSMRLRTSRSSNSGKARPMLPIYAGQGGLQPAIRDMLSQRALFDAADEAGSTP